MKKWNAAEIVELNIAETANGCVDYYKEVSIDLGCWGDIDITNDSLTNGKEETIPGTPDELS